MTLLSVHGRRADWVRNIEAEPRVRLRRGLRWYNGVATVVDATEEELHRFNAYARTTPRVFGMDGEPLALVRRAGTGAGKLSGMDCASTCSADEVRGGCRGGRRRRRG